MSLPRFFLRSLASNAKSTKPPIQLFGLDATYANAFYSASIQDSSIDKSFQSLTSINDLLKTDAIVRDTLNNPLLGREDRKTVASTIASNLKLDKTTANFLDVLAENNRLSELQSIYKQFFALNEAYKGVVEAKVFSAKPLDSKILRRLQAAIGKSSFLGDGKTLRLSNEVNPDILGGLVVEVGEKTVDLSIASKLAKLNNTLSQAL